MFGSANGLQLSIYNKTLQARATDKLDYWESVWATLNGDPFGSRRIIRNPPARGRVAIRALNRLSFSTKVWLIRASWSSCGLNSGSATSHMDW